MMVARVVLGILLSLLTVVSHGANGRQKIILLTSVDEWNTGPFYIKSYNRNLPHRLEEIFKRSDLKNKFDLQVIHSASQDDLFRSLHNVNVAAVFWASHGATTQSGFIVDRAGFDVKDIFTSAGKNIKYIGVIGCYSEQILKSNRNGEQLSSTRIEGFSNTTWSEKGLKFLLEKSKSYLSQNQIEEHVTAKSLQYFQLTRKAQVGIIDKAFPAIRLEDKSKKILITLPRANPGDLQSAVFAMEAPSDLVVSTGTPVFGNFSDIEIGDIEIKPISDTNIKWEVFTDPTTGRPWGNWRRLLAVKAIL